MDPIKLLDTVALAEACPEQGLRRGEVEFSDDSGEAYAFASLRAEQLMPLYYRKRAAQFVPEAA